MSDFIKQSTINNIVFCSGIGVHSGKVSNLTMKPAPIDSGIIFIRADISDKNNKIIANWENVSDTRLCTVLSNEDGVSVSTVEHILSAIYAAGIDNIIIEVDNLEVPIMDGSSAAFTELIAKAGLTAQDAKKNFLLIKSIIEVKEDDKTAKFSPATGQFFNFEIDFDSKAIGEQSYAIDLNSNDYAKEISRARTFGFLHEVEAMRSAGLAKGGSLDNAIVIDGDKILNSDGLRYETEFSRHKLLDAIGDMALANMQIIGHYSGIKSGHKLNNNLLHALFAKKDAWEIINMTKQQYRAMCSSNLSFDKLSPKGHIIAISPNGYRASCKTV